jgi:hypothetical protein
VHDLTPVAELFHGEETVVFADAGYQGIEKQKEIKGTGIGFRVARRCRCAAWPSRRRHCPGSGGRPHGAGCHGSSASPPCSSGGAAGPAVAVRLLGSSRPHRGRPIQRELGNERRATTGCRHDRPSQGLAVTHQLIEIRKRHRGFE